MNKYKSFSKSDSTKTKEFFIAQATLDYHDLKITHHYQIEDELNLFLKDCKKSKIDKVLVITGKGLVIQPTIKNLLKTHPLVEKYNMAGYYNGQCGAFEVWITKI